MRGIKAVMQITTLLCWAAAVQAESVVSYSVQLGGYNHASDWKAGQRVPYTPGSAADGQVYPAGTAVNWAVAVAAWGNHVQPGHPSDGFPIEGVANFVFDLEIRESGPTGPLAATARFYSSINDATGGDPIANAAFTLNYSVGGSGPGRVFDRAVEGGPNLEIKTYPSSHNFPLSDNPRIALGELVGMGAGYRFWDRAPGSNTLTTPGVGLMMLPYGGPGLGIGPVAEGQIDTSLMSPGSYTLLVTGSRLGSNVLRGDIDLSQGGPTTGSYAVRANAVLDDQINFVIVPEPATILLFALSGFAWVRTGRRARGESPRWTHACRPESSTFKSRCPKCDPRFAAWRE